MKNYNIKREISFLNATELKYYNCLYKDFGFEMGFGKAGTYVGHSHLFFTDLIFSMDGIELLNGRGKSSNLLIVPPRTYMEDVKIGDFFFLKFSQEKVDLILPDKTDSRIKEGLIENYSQEVKLTYSWYKTYYSQESQIDIHYNKFNLLVFIKGELSFKIN